LWSTLSRWFTSHPGTDLPLPLSHHLKSKSHLQLTLISLNAHARDENLAAFALCSSHQRQR
jgi:hypothetical protein